MAKKKTVIERLRAYALVGATLVVFALLVGCGTADPPPTAQIGATKVYPGAKDVMTKEMQAAWRSPGIEQYQTVDFRTTDAPDAVLSYFRDTLLGEGWAISGCQGAEGSLTFSWVYPFSVALEIIEVDVSTNRPTNVRLTYARHFYRSVGPKNEIHTIPPNPVEVLKEAGLTDCIGVYNIKTEQTTLAGYFALALVVMVWLLHIRTLASDWNSRKALLISTISMLFVTPAVWLIIGIGAEVMSGLIHLPVERYSQLREAPWPMVVAQLVFRAPMLSAGIIVMLTAVGALIKELLKRARLRSGARAPGVQSE